MSQKAPLAKTRHPICPRNSEGKHLGCFPCCSAATHGPGKRGGGKLSGLRRSWTCPQFRRLVQRPLEQPNLQHELAPLNTISLAVASSHSIHWRRQTLGTGSPPSPIAIQPITRLMPRPAQTQYRRNSSKSSQAGRRIRVTAIRIQMNQDGAAVILPYALIGLPGSGVTAVLSTQHRSSSNCCVLCWPTPPSQSQNYKYWLHQQYLT